MNTQGAHTVILAAGGTGGHIFPAEALAEALLARHYQPVLVTDARSHAYAAGVFSTIPVHTIRCGTLGRGIAGKIKGVADLAAGVFQAHRLLGRLAPVAVVGFGGYPSFPTLFAATQRGIYSVIHEQNAVLGRANRLLAGWVDAIATSYPATKHLRQQDAKKAHCTGNPVRAAVRALHEVPYPELTADGMMRILVTGGSQGASVLSEVLPQAVGLLPAALRARLRIDQQCRDADIAAARAAYHALGVNADLATFFTDIPARLASAHLVIARAGASTVAELTVAGRPGLLVPLPSAMDDHQTVNAAALEEAGGGWVVPQEAFTPAALAARIEALLALPATLAKAAAAARSVGVADAAQDLARLVLRE